MNNKNIFTELFRKITSTAVLLLESKFLPILVAVFFLLITGSVLIIENRNKTKVTQALLRSETANFVNGMKNSETNLIDTLERITNGWALTKPSSDSWRREMGASYEKGKSILAFVWIKKNQEPWVYPPERADFSRLFLSEVTLKKQADLIDSSQEFQASDVINLPRFGNIILLSRALDSSAGKNGGKLFLAVDINEFVTTSAKLSEFQVRLRARGNTLFLGGTELASRSSKWSSTFHKRVFGKDTEISYLPSHQLIHDAVGGMNVFIACIGAIFSFLFGALVYYAQKLKKSQTETYIAQQKAEQGESAVRSVMAQLPISVIELDRMGNCRFANDSWSEFSGLPLSASLGQAWAELIHPWDRDAVFQDLESVIADKKSKKLEIRIQNKKKEIAIVEFRMKPKIEPNGEIVVALCTIKDNTSENQRRIRNELLKSIDCFLFTASNSETMIASILELVCQHLGWKYGAFWRVDSNDNVLKLDKSWFEVGFGLDDFDRERRTLQVKRGEGLPGHIWESISAQWVGDLRKEVQSASTPNASHGGFQSAFGFPVVVENQILGVIEFFGETMNEPDHDFLSDCDGIGIRIGEIQKRNESERKLHDALNWVTQQKLALDSAAIVAITDIKGNITYANDKFVEISKYSREELLGKNHRLLKSSIHGPEFFAEMWKTIATGKVWKGEVCNRNKSGEHYWVDTTIVPFKNSEGKIIQYTAIRMDITNRKNAENQLVQTAKMSSLGIMASGIAHEVNNPLAIISGLATQVKIIALREPLDREMLTDKIDRIESTVVRIAKIVKGLRSFAREGANDNFREVTLGEIFEETLEFCRERFKGAGVGLIIENINKDIRIECQGVQISQVLLNLLSNACDAITALEEKWIKIEVADMGETIQIIVTDSGQGIDEKTAVKIFEPFYTTKEVGKGTGLGLSISKGIVEAHHGRMFLKGDSEHTSFIVELPKKLNMIAKAKAA